jgi:ABC-2 type transport system permease protein
MNKFRLLLSEQLLSQKSTLPFLLFLQIIVPLAFVFSMGHYAGVRPSDGQLIRIISGSITFNLAFLGLSSVAGKISMLRQDGSLLHYISFPVSKFSFISAILTAKLIVIFPGLFVPLIGGLWLYGLKLNVSPWLLVAMLLGTFSLAMAGAALGALVHNYELVSVLTGVIIFVSALLAPTFMSPEVLPLPLQILGWLLPTTYISDALTLSLRGIYNLNFFVDIGILAVLAVLGGVLVRRYLEWQVR